MPALLTQKKFDFTSHSPGLGADAFSVVNFTGFEGFSTCYRFEITLVGNDPEIDITAVLEHPATFTILREEGDIPFHGILTEFEQLHAIDEYVVFRTVLSPRLWWLSLTHHNQVFLDKTVPQVLAAVLEDGGLTTDDFELRLVDEGAYEPWEFICQYGESHLDFVSRWMEREGMYYYFEQTLSGEKVIITDTAMAHGEMPEGGTMYYSPPSGLDEPFREEVIHAFICKQKLLPGKVHVQDYNYRTPSLNLTAEAEVSARGRGEFHIYGDHFRTLNEGKRLADLRSQELRSHEKRFHGESTIPFLRPGYLFDLERHYRSGFNQQYLTIELEHAGSQAAFLISGIQQTLSETEKRAYYRNTFVTIPSEIQYRHPKKSEKPRFYGTINATIDAEGSGEYAELDDQGRYKVRLPFDLSGSSDGKASHWLRMTQPYAGTDHGMHFPLHKGTEVLLTFIEGDPDRPIIAGAVPNPEKPSVVKDANQTQAAITTSGQNKIHFEDQDGNQRILMHSPTANSWIRVGSHNDPITLNGPNPMYLYKGDTYEDPGANHGETPLTGDPSTINTASTGTYTVTYSYQHPGETTKQTATRSVVVRDPSAVHDTEVTTSQGIRVSSSGNLWFETSKGFGEYHLGKPNDAPANVQMLLNKFGTDYNPTNLIPYGGTNSQTVAQALPNSHLRVSATDTFNTQEGNIYDFGGYWNYNLGNSYSEDHIDQSGVELNATHSKKIPDKDKLTGSGQRIASGVLQGAGALAGGPAGLVLGGVVMGVQQGLAETAKRREVGDAVESGGPQSGEEKTIETEEAKVTGLTTGNTWVEKKFGNSYSYAEGDSIDISHGNSEEHSSGNSYSYTYGGTHEETKISGGGIRTAWSKSGGGVSEEKTWDGMTGNFMSYEYKNHGHFTFSANFPRPWPTLAISMSMENIKGSISFSAGINLSADFKLAANFSFTAAVATDISIIFAPAGKIEIKNLEVDADFFGFKYKSNPPIDVETELTKLKSGQLSLSQGTLELASKVNDLDNSAVKLDTVYTLHLMS